VDNDAGAGAKNITLQEQRAVDGLDHHVPMILRDGRIYNGDLDRFLLDLPLNGVRSRHSLRAYGYDVMVWVRFLEQACDKGVWEAERGDVTAFHRARRREEVGARISAASWNRSVAALEKLYRWAEVEGVVGASPFVHRHVWRRGHASQRIQVVARNESYERAAKRSDVRFVSLDDYRVFRDVGIRGLAPSGGARAEARDRNGARNALFADLLVTTGLRLEEASFLLAFELDGLAKTASCGRQTWFKLPSALTKGDRGRSVLMPRRLIQQIAAYVTVERTLAVAKFQSRSGWREIDRPILIRRPFPGAIGLSLANGGTVPIDAVPPEERGRLVICRDDGSPEELAALWLTEAAGYPLRVSPHQLRHTFAVHMLAMLIQHRLREAGGGKTEASMEVYRRLLGDPLQQVQRLLGHASLATTMIYLDHIASRSDTIDSAVEELFALVPEARLS
jgi:site-specific recombinase XerD